MKEKTIKYKIHEEVKFAYNVLNVLEENIYDKLNRKLCVNMVDEVFYFATYRHLYEEKPTNTFW